MSKSPITNQIGAIFLHVSDMERSIQWYNDLLGLPVHSSGHEGTIYSLDMIGGSALLLDSNMKNIENKNNKTQFFFDTKNLVESYNFIKEKGIEIVTEIEVHEAISFFTFKDLDGNILMICEDKRNL
ncbi:VOC family protein [Paenibacillus sp. FSL R5-0519]|uniref:VOC family protein n=1 Tax=Paenibacillus sp. FSL R5-0519 TaxID=2921648 RepID=UPI0030DD166F